MTKASKEPLISVIIPVYNVEEYLDRCLESVANQTYKNIEIILIDDGSTDNSGKMCDQWAEKDRRIRVIHQKNGGLSNARNKGIEEAKGEFISFVDSDDWIEANMLTDFISIAMTQHCDIVCSDPFHTNGKKQISKKRKKKIITYSQYEFVKRYLKINSNKTLYYAHSKLFRKNIIEANIYPEGLTAEDVVGTYICILNSKKICLTTQKYYNYFYNPNSITRNGFNKNNFDLIPIWDKMIDITKKRAPQYIAWAKLNRARINYTLLMRMRLQLSKEIILTKYKREYVELLNNLKQNLSFLLKSPIPISRKLTIIFIILDSKFI